MVDGYQSSGDHLSVMLTIEFELSQRVSLVWRRSYGTKVSLPQKDIRRQLNPHQDSADWAIGNQAQYTNASVNAMMAGWLSGPKSPGLCILEHELNPNTIGVFETNYPLMVSNGWKVETIADAWSMDWYQNSPSNTGPVTSMAVGSGALLVNSSSSAMSASSTSTSASVSSSSSQSSSATSMTSTAKSGGSSALAQAAASVSASASPSKASNAGARYTFPAAICIAMVGVASAMLL
jgi:chitin deacetylase